jgi:LSD1 subclass zinc finger protein
LGLTEITRPESTFTSCKHYGFDSACLPISFTDPMTLDNRAARTVLLESYAGSLAIESASLAALFGLSRRAETSLVGAVSSGCRGLLRHPRGACVWRRASYASIFIGLGLAGSKTGT